MPDEKILEEARKRMEAKRSFLTHLAVFVMVGFFLFILNFLVAPDELFFHVPMIGWSIGLFIHFVIVYGNSLFTSKRWKEKTLQKEIEKLQREKRTLPNEEFLNLDVPRMELEEIEKVDKEWKEDDIV